MDNTLQDPRPTLVVGATGQLGSRIVRRLTDAGRPVRALVRPGSRDAHLRRPGVEIAVGDLTDRASLDVACRGAGAVLATANAVAPLRGSRFDSVEDRGYANLIAACVGAKLGRFVFISVPVTPVDEAVPLFRYKRLIEQRLFDSGLEVTVFRAGPFMDDWFAFMGSHLPARGDEAPLVARPWPFLQRFIGLIGGLIEQHGIAIVPGPAATRQRFIAIDDVAAYMVAAIDHPAPRQSVLEIGGPEALSWNEVASLYAQVLGRPVKTWSTPAAVFRIQQLLMRPFSEAASNIMGLNWVAARTMPIHDTGHAATFGIRLTSAEQFLRAQAARPLTPAEIP